MNKVLIVDPSDSNRRLMSGLLVKSGYEPIAVDSMEAAKEAVAQLPPGAVVVTAMKFARGTAQELINWQKRDGREPAEAAAQTQRPQALTATHRAYSTISFILRFTRHDCRQPAAIPTTMSVTTA